MTVGPDEHYVDPRPFPPADRPDSAGLARPTGHWRLMARKFARHRLAVISGLILLLSYASLPVAGFIAPYDPGTRHVTHINAPPQTIRLFRDGWPTAPYVYGFDVRVDLEQFRRVYTVDRRQVYPLHMFCAGEPHHLFGVIPSTLHLFCAPEGGTVFLLGTDRLGRDVFSRLVAGAVVSLTVGLIGITISLALGVVIGGLAGYFGGMIDHAVQRVIEIMRSIPELPLWMALAAALPATWSPLLTYFGITIILGLLDWPSLARAVRAKFLSLREEDYVTAARLMGASRRRIILCHMVPNFASHLVASATLSVPAMILGETALSFLGLGLRPPIVSWGVMLSDAQNLAAVELHPWLLAPVIPVMVTVLAFNFLGDGLRDAADPHT
ncbi:MAG: ABC transporter permease [Alphaproteobacteria bacterium]